MLFKSLIFKDEVKHLLSPPSPKEIFLIYLFIGFVLQGINGASATPLISPIGVKKLEKPGLWLSMVKWRQPETGSAGTFSFRVYCPTLMMRDVSNGKWGEAKRLSVMETMGYPTGIPLAAYKQACGAD
jgi:hypothetical protein